MCLCFFDEVEFLAWEYTIYLYKLCTAVYIHTHHTHTRNTGYTVIQKRKKKKYISYRITLGLDEKCYIYAFIPRYAETVNESRILRNNEKIESYGTSQYT